VAIDPLLLFSGYQSPAVVLRRKRVAGAAGRPATGVAADLPPVGAFMEPFFISPSIPVQQFVIDHVSIVVPSHCYLGLSINSKLGV
jgi:hypothetical protein